VNITEIPFNVPFISGNEIEYIQQVFDLEHFSGNGKFTRRAQEWLENHLGAPRVLLTHSCTGALEIASLLLDLGPGDEVIMPSFTFVTTASSVMRSGAKPVFCEIKPGTMNIDPADVEFRITERNSRFVFKVRYPRH
jgi:dTDP-4-amino-4,6-dideoxygalactose transaminase